MNLDLIFLGLTASAVVTLTFMVVDAMLVRQKVHRQMRRGGG